MSNYREIYEDIYKVPVSERQATFRADIRELKDQLDRIQDSLDQEIERIQARCPHAWMKMGEFQIRCVHCDLIDFDQ